MEKCSDLKVSTLRGDFEGNGGTLKLLADFPERALVQIGCIGELGGATSDGTTRPVRP